MKILITGGAGFVGSHLAGLYRQTYPQAHIVAVDNLKRRGSELNIPRLKSWGVEFYHGDIRILSDLQSLSGSFDLLIEASAEPSVLAGMGADSPQYAIHTNLTGTVNCLEFARERCGALLFLSTSRVYSIPRLSNIPLKTGKTRFELNMNGQEMVGLTNRGIAESFSTEGYRSLYGSTKLSSELLIQEYAHAYGLKALINRCSVLSGPWQMGKIDQGVFTLWMVRHTFGGHLQYTGFDGRGLQVRDLLHPRDLFALLERQVASLGHDGWAGDVYNVGGGAGNSVSLAELTKLCQEITGRTIEIGSVPQSNSVDIPYFVTDVTKVSQRYNWKPQVSVPEVMGEIHKWLKEHETQLKYVF